MRLKTSSTGRVWSSVKEVSRDLEVFHEHSDDDVDKDELWDEHEDDEVDWSHDRVDAAVTHTVHRRVAVASQRVLRRNATVHQSPYGR